MTDGMVQIYYGQGRGKSTAALGNAIQMAGMGRQVVMIEFLKKKDEEALGFLKRLEPEIKSFRFSRNDECFEKLSKEEQQEEIMNLRNGYFYGKKVAGTGGCDLLVLDEILGLVDEQVITVDELKELLENKTEEMSVICTGRSLPEELISVADEIYHITTEK